MNLHIFKCNECRYFQTDDCNWENTKENNIACDGFCHKIATQSWDGTLPLPDTEPWNSVASVYSLGKPIEIGGENV